MQRAHRLLSIAVLTCLSASAFAATTYTTSASFMAQVAPGAYSENFNSWVTDPPAGALVFSSGGFTYSAFAVDDLYLSAGFLGTSQINKALTLTFTSGNVTAVGANFFALNISDAFQAVSVTITLSDGTVSTFTPTSMADSFRGFTSSTPITSLTFSAPGQSLYASLDNLTVGVAAVPEPANWALTALGLAGVIAARRRKVA